MPPLNYSKWDNLDDSDDDEPKKSSVRPTGEALGGGSSKAGGEKQSATVTAGFVIRTSIAGGSKLYINICSSLAVPGGGMTAVPDASNGLAANMPYICGDMRQDDDGGKTCLCVEFIFAPATLKAAADNKQAAEVCIKTALAVVAQNHQNLAVDQTDWSLFEHDAIREVTGAHFFAPGKMADQDLDGVE